MAEVFGAVSAAASLLEVSGQVLSQGYVFISKVIRAPRQVRALLEEIAAINSVLDTLLDQFSDLKYQSSREDGAGRVAALQKLLTLGTFSACEALLRETEAGIRKCEQLEGQPAKNLAKRLIWPLKEKETSSLIQRLTRMRDSLNAALNADSAAALRRIEENQAQLLRSVDNVADAVAYTIDVKKECEILAWVARGATYPEDNFRTALEKCMPETGKWLLNSFLFRHWLEASPPILWIHGIPGAGKTSLCSAMIQHTRSTLCTDSRSTTIYFYCDQSDERRRSTSQLLATIVRQLCTASKACVQDAFDFYASKGPNSSAPPNAEELVALLQAMSANFGRVYLFVDALDESDSSLLMLDALVELIKVIEAGSTVWRVFLTSRTNVFLASGSRKEIAGAALHDKNHTDIAEYVSREIKRRADPAAADYIRIRDPKLRLLVERSLIENSKGLFLYAKLQLDYLSGMMTDKAIRQGVLTFVPGLNSTYSKILQRIQASPAATVELIRGVLFYVSICLTSKVELETLPHVAAAQMKDEEFDEDNLADAYSLVQVCDNFLVIDKAYTPTATVRLAHLSVMDFLQSEELRDSPWTTFHVDTCSAHLSIAIACLKYLSSTQICSRAQQSIDLDAFLDRWPFYTYAAQHWADHLRLSQVDMHNFEERVRPHLVWFLSPELAPGPFSIWRSFVSAFHSGEVMPPMYYAISLKLVHVFDTLLPSFHALNEQFDTGDYPITLAARREQLDMLKSLVEAGADVMAFSNPEKTQRLTALHIAAERAHLDMVRYLLSKGAMWNARSNSRSTPFYRAARGGSVEVMTLIKNAGAQIDSKTYDGYTPLIEAVERSHYNAVDALLAWGADPFATTSDGESVLWFAVVHGNHRAWDALCSAYSKAGRELPPDLVDMYERSKMHKVSIMGRLFAKANRKASNIEKSMPGGVMTLR